MTMKSKLLDEAYTSDNLEFFRTNLSRYEEDYTEVAIRGNELKLAPSKFFKIPYVVREYIYSIFLQSNPNNIVEYWSEEYTLIDLSPNISLLGSYQTFHFVYDKEAIIEEPDPHKKELVHEAASNLYDIYSVSMTVLGTDKIIYPKGANFETTILRTNELTPICLYTDVNIELGRSRSLFIGNKLAYLETSKNTRFTFKQETEAPIYRCERI